MQKFAVYVGIFDNITFVATSKSNDTYWAIQDIEFNGFICKDYKDCVDNVLYKRCSRYHKHFSVSHLCVATIILSISQ